MAGLTFLPTLKLGTPFTFAVARRSKLFTLYARLITCSLLILFLSMLIMSYIFARFKQI